MVKKAEVKTKSITSLSIAAINKAEQLKNSAEATLSSFKSIYDEVNKIKSDLNLGLAQYEAEIQEKMNAMEEQLILRQEEVATLIKLRQEDLNNKYAELAKEVEEKHYQHKIAIEREDLNTANTIANKKGLGLFDLNIETKHQTALDKTIKDLETSSKIAISSAVKNTKEELNETIRSKDTQITILNNDLKNSTDKVTTLQAEIAYLKEQLNASRQQTVDALAAAKVNVQQTNQGK